MSNTYFMWTLEKLQEFWDDHISALFARKNSVYTKTEIDTKTAALEGAMAVVQSTDTATVAISSGQYVLWKGSLYTASSAIAIDDTLSLSNLTAVTGGGFNALDSARASGDTALGGRVDLVNGAMAIVATGDVAPQAISEGQYVLWGGVLHTANSAIADGATLTVSNLTPVTDGGFNALNDGLTSLNSNLAQVLCRKSMLPGPSTIEPGTEKNYIVTELIPTGYTPICVYYEQYLGTSNAHLECSLLKSSDGNWYAALYNYYNATLNVNPKITVWFAKNGYFAE